MGIRYLFSARNNEGKRFFFLLAHSPLPLTFPRPRSLLNDFSRVCAYNMYAVFLFFASTYTLIRVYSIQYIIYCIRVRIYLYFCEKCCNSDCYWIFFPIERLTRDDRITVSYTLYTCSSIPFRCIRGCFSSVFVGFSRVRFYTFYSTRHGPRIYPCD